jgi:hypothetical protein
MPSIGAFQRLSPDRSLDFRGNLIRASTEFDDHLDQTNDVLIELLKLVGGHP